MPGDPKRDLKLPRHDELANTPLQGYPLPGPILRDKLERFIKDNKARWATQPQAKQAALIQKELAKAGFDEAELAAAGLDAAVLIQQGLNK